jgi:hypothetical protein
MIRVREFWGPARNSGSVKSTSHRLSYRVPQINDFLWDVAVSEKSKNGHSARQIRLLISLSALIFLESALLAAATVYLGIELSVSTPKSYASAIALAVLTAIAALWLVFIGLGVLRQRPWVRGAIMTWQILQLAVGLGCFQGAVSRPDVGLLLCVPAIAALVLLFTKPVMAATARRPG